MLGGGREKKEDTIDPAVGLVLHKKVGDPVQKGEAFCTVHYNSDARLGSAQNLLQQAYRIAEKPPAVRRPLIHRVISGKGARHDSPLDLRAIAVFICTTGRREWAV